MSTVTMDRLRAKAPVVAFGALIVMLLAGMLVPVYTDEIGWRFQERAAIDGVDKMFNDLCGANTLAAPPWFMMPVRFFSATANQALASPLFVRIEGVACALAWAGMMWLLTARLQGDAAERAKSRTMLFSVLSLGVLPFLMVFSRPEQSVMLMLMLAMFAALLRPATLSPWLATAKVAAIVLFGMIALSYHLKGVVYSPVFFACIVACAKGRGTVAPRVVGGAALAGLTLIAAQYWTHRFQCPGDPVTAGLLAQENVAAVLANGGSWVVLAQALVSGTMPLNYVWLAVPVITYVKWIPGPEWTSAETIVFAMALLMLWGGLIVCALVELYRFVRREKLAALGEPRALIALALLGCLAAWGASQLHRNLYEASLYLPLTAVFCALCLSLPIEQGKLRQRGSELLVRFGLPCSLLSVVFILATSLGPLLQAANSKGWIADKRISVSAFGYGQVRQDIDTAMGRTGMGGDRRLNRLLLDDVTYLALQRHALPQHRLGVLGDWKGQITDPVAYLRSVNSDGVVIGCRYLPQRMRNVAARVGEVCAISRPGLDRLAASGPTRFGDGEEY